MAAGQQHPIDLAIYDKTDYEWKYLRTNASVKIGVGNERIEQIQDFRHAVLLLNEHEKSGF